MSKGFTTSYRIALLATTVLAMFAGLEVRLVWLHVIDRDDLLRSVDEARRQLIVGQAPAEGGHRRLPRQPSSPRAARSWSSESTPSSIRIEDRPKWPLPSDVGFGVPLVGHRARPS